MKTATTRNYGVLDGTASGAHPSRHSLSAPGLKVLVQNPLTLSYLQEAPGQWTSDIQAALTFKDSTTACLFCAHHGLYDLQVAIKFPDGRHDVEIPVLSGLPAASRLMPHSDTHEERLAATGDGIV